MPKKTNHQTLNNKNELHVKMFKNKSNALAQVNERVNVLVDAATSENLREKITFELKFNWREVDWRKNLKDLFENN